MEIEPNRVLFICGHNAGRSQMSEAFFNQMISEFPALTGKWEAVSASTRPGDAINPLVTKVMSEIGINLDPVRHHPKGLDDNLIKQIGPSIRRVIIACDDECILPSEIPANIPKESWKLPDPHGQPIEVVRTVRDLTKARVNQLLQEL